MLEQALFHAGIVLAEVLYELLLVGVPAGRHQWRRLADVAEQLEELSTAQCAR